MKILVTGGTGFTGEKLTNKLVELGFDLRLLVRDSQRAKKKLGGLKCEYVQGDVTDATAVERAIRGVDKVFHIAAAYRTAGMKDSGYWNVNVTGTENVMRASLIHGVRKVVHCSTVGVHGHIEVPPANEDSPFDPGDIYQLTKLKGEERAHEYAREKKLPVTVIRPCAIYGPGDMRLYKLFRIASRKYTALLGRGDIFYHMVYVDDLVDALILASVEEKWVDEVFIIGGPDYLNLTETIRMISRELGVRPKVFHLPVGPFWILGAFLEMIFVPLGLQPPIYRRRVDFFIKSRAFSIRKARNLLKYEPTVPLREGITRTIAWYKTQGLL